MKRLLLALLLASPATAQTYDPVLTQAGLQGSPTTMVPLNLGDDSTRQVNLTFPFEYYGQTFSTAWVSSNGFVSFGNVGHLCCNGYSLDQAPRNTIYGYWTDLISSGNPYYRLTDTDALFGWYDTREYGTNNSVTMEINLASSGAIQITYGAVANTYHQVAAGITGPTADDNIQLFLGTNVSSLSFQSGILSPSQPEPVLNCQTTPDAPECVQTYNPVDVAPDVTAAADVIPQETVTVTETPAEEVVAEQTSTEEAVTEEPAAEETATEQTTQEEAVAEETVDDSETAEVAASDNASDERLSPDEVLALAALQADVAAERIDEAKSDAVLAASTEGQSTAQSEGSQSETSSASQSESASQSASVSSEAAQIEASSSSIVSSSSDNLESSRPEVVAERTKVEEEASSESVMPITLNDAEQAVTNDLHSGLETASAESDIIPVDIVQSSQYDSSNDMSQMSKEDTGSSTSQSVTMELLGNSMPETNAAPDMGQVSGNSNDSMSELAVIPAGYGSYSQARIPDAPFYAPKDIYKNRKVPDAYWQLYRMMQSQNTAWSDMVEDQYER